jgi:hypothetical protein
MGIYLVLGDSISIDNYTGVDGTYVPSRSSREERERERRERASSKKSG